MMNKQALKIATLALPIIVMIATSALHYHNMKNGNLWRIPISGYDPRDLLRGHYLLFQYDWNYQNPENADMPACQGNDCALCLYADPPSSPINPRAVITNKAYAKAHCTDYLFGSVKPGSAVHFDIGQRKGDRLTRYYIPENHANALDRMLRARGEEKKHQFEMGLRLNKKGYAYIEAIYIDGIPLENWLKHNL